MAGNRTNTGGMSASTNCALFGRMKASSGRSIWVSLEPSLDIMEELIYHFTEVVELSEDEIQTESDAWRAKGLVARSLGRKIAGEAAVHEFRLRGGLKGDVVGFNLDDGFMGS